MTEVSPQKVACVEIGGIPIALSTSDERFLDLLRQRYEGFLSSSGPEFELQFDLTPAGPVSDDYVRTGPTQASSSSGCSLPVIALKLWMAYWTTFSSRSAK